MLRLFLLVFPLIASIALAGCGKSADPAPSSGAIDIPAIVARAAALAAKGCLVKPFAESIGPLVANAIDIALLGGVPVAITVEALAHQAADAFCAVVQANGGPKVGARRGASTGPVNYGTVEVRGKQVAILGTPVAE